jgi:excisionase family DNA binding protein
VGSPTPLLVSPRLGAQLAGIGRDEFYRRVREGDIASIRVGRRYLVPVWAIEDWVRREAMRDETS